MRKGGLSSIEILIFILLTGVADSQVLDDKLFSMDKLNWMLDSWVGEWEGGKVFRTWVKVNDNLFKGEAFAIREGDTIFSELLEIEKTGDDISYTARVPCNTQPVPFKLVKMSESEAAFENPEHDLRFRIVYSLKEDGSLCRRTEGKNEEGKEVIEEFFFKKLR